MESNRFEQLAKEHLSALLSYCLAQTCDMDRAEELVQETLYRAFRSFHNLKNPDAFFPWLIGIAKRASWSWYRKWKRDPLRKRFNPSGSTPPATIQDTKQNPLEKLAETERAESTLKAIKRLSEKNREVVILRFFEQLSYTDMAKRLQISVDAVDQRLTRAKKELSKMLKPLEM